MHLLEQLPKPVIFAHRGSSKFAPENTMAAFKMAKTQGATGIELDVMLSKDLVPVVIHDRIVERTTNGKGKVDQKTCKELQDLDAGSFFSKKYNDERIPELEQVLKNFGQNFIINIELKNFHAPCDPLPEIVVGLVKKYGLHEMVLYSSFIPGNLRKIKKLAPESKVALLCPPGFRGKVFSSKIFFGLSPTCIHPFFKDITPDFLEKEHCDGRRVHAWTVNNEHDALPLIENNIDGIITDDPLLMMNLLHNLRLLKQKNLV